MDCSDIIQLTGVMVSVAAIIISSIVTNKNTNKQIKNQNKETYRPRLRLKEFDNTETNLTETSNMIFSYYHKEKNNDRQYTKMTIENIGYGIANDIEFYDLIHGNKCYRVQSVEDKINQVNFSTYEIAKEATQNFQMLISFDINSVNDKKNKNGDFILILCNYKDLNGNNYKILIGYTIKNILYDVNILDNVVYFNSYYYQEGTKEYINMIERYKTQYKEILKLIEEKK